MPVCYIERSIEPVLKRSVKEFPAVVLVGPCQSGKTTLLKHLFSERYQYVSLEPPDVRMAAAEDPRGFIEMYTPPVIFDEVQYAPDLLPYIKIRFRIRLDYWFCTRATGATISWKARDKFGEDVDWRRILFRRNTHNFKLMQKCWFLWETYSILFPWWSVS